VRVRGNTTLSRQKWLVVGKTWDFIGFYRENLGLLGDFIGFYRENLGLKNNTIVVPFSKAQDKITCFE
jgi:hypothetical protein